MDQNQKLKELGSNWWRAEQFFRLALQGGKNKNPEFFLINVGLMGHFIADNGVAFHVVEDYDGRKTGHSGLHDFYESYIPSLLGSDLLSKVVRSAQNEKIYNTDFLVSMRRLAAESFKDVSYLLETDPVTTKSFTEKPANRKSGEEIITLWEPVIVKAMGRSAALMAIAMEEAYRQSNKPVFNEVYVKFPLMPEYVEPDYFKP
jgi:hypothetical protein